MRILKIMNEKGYYSTDGNHYEVIDKITKEDLMLLLDRFVTEECEMDPYSDEQIKNPAHQIIYRNIYGKLNELSSQKNIFMEEGKTLYQAAIQKYSE